MPRPKKPRTIGCLPKASCFKPNGIPAHNLPRIALDADELEALRLADVVFGGRQSADLAQSKSR